MKGEKFSVADLKKVSGGTMDEAWAYADQLIIKYGLEPGDYATLDGMMTSEELDYLSDLIVKDL